MKPVAAIRSGNRSEPVSRIPSDFSKLRCFGRRIIALLAFVALFVVGAPAAAQEARQPTATLTLEEAIGLARQNNPTFRATANDEAVADWEVRQAYGQFLPRLDVANRFSYTAEGTQQAFGSFTAADLNLGRTLETYTSNYSVGLGLNLGGATFFQASSAKANSKAVSARVDAAEYTLATDVTRQYLTALRARDGVDIAQSALESAQQALRLAQARMDVGDATRLDLARAEVDHGRAEVEVIQAENQRQTEALRLMQLVGVVVDREIELTSTFEVFEPTWTLDELVATALAGHPELMASRASETAARATSRAARMSYFPTLSISAGWSGFVRRTGTSADILKQTADGIESSRASCVRENELFGPLPAWTPRDCSAIQMTDEIRDRALSANSAFPFNYQQNPFSMGLTVSLPIWDQFSREVRTQSARVAADNATHQRRAEELNRHTEVATNLLGLRTAFQTVALEERNIEVAGEQLLLAREQYRLGAGSILELTNAQEQKVRADQAHLAALYTFHETLAALEAAVGRKLR